MAHTCEHCGNLLGPPMLLQQHLFEAHGTSTPPRKLQKLRSKALINHIPDSSSEAARADKKTRLKRSKSIQTVPGGRSITKFRSSGARQRVPNGNTNGLLRQYFPKGTSPSNVSQGKLDAVARKLHEMRRKTLGYESPAEPYRRTVAWIR